MQMLYDSELILNCKEKKKKKNALRRTQAHFVNCAVSPTALITGHECNVEERNVWCDLQPKCQCFTLASRERARQTHTKRQRREMESGCVRKSQRNRCLSVSGRKGEAVRREMTEKGDGETGGVCVHALSWLRAGCYSSWRASPSSPRTSGVRSVCGEGGRGGGGNAGEEVVTASKHSFLTLPLCAFSPDALHPSELWLVCLTHWLCFLLSAPTLLTYDAFTCIKRALLRP